MFAKAVYVQLPPAIQPVAGYEQAAPPGVVVFLSKREVLLTGAIIVQLPSDIERSSDAGIPGFLSASL